MTETAGKGGGGGRGAGLAQPSRGRLWPPGGPRALEAGGARAASEGRGRLQASAMLHAAQHSTAQRSTAQRSACPPGPLTSEHEHTEWVKLQGEWLANDPAHYHLHGRSRGRARGAAAALRNCLDYFSGLWQRQRQAGRQGAAEQRAFLKCTAGPPCRQRWPGGLSQPG